MKTYKCKGCYKRCEARIDLPDGQVPEVCLLGGDASWQKIEESDRSDTAELPEKEPLPKLTVESLAERGIEWPEKARYAAVNGGGELCASSMARFYENKPGHTAVAWFDPVKQWQAWPIPGKWDASDWTNSLIERPAVVKAKLPEWCRVGVHVDGYCKEMRIEKISDEGVLLVEVGIDHHNCMPATFESLKNNFKPVYKKSVPEETPEKELPEWCQVGAWCRNLDIGWYGVIRQIDDERLAVTIPDHLIDGEARYDWWNVAKVIPARVRPWMFEEAPPFVKTMENSDYQACCWYLNGSHGEKVSYWCRVDNIITTDEMAQKFTQLNGLPCGVLEVVE